MAAVSGPTQESSGSLLRVADALPACLSKGNETIFASLSKEMVAPMNVAFTSIGSTRQQKIEVNSYLPIVAAGYALGELDLNDLVTFFSHYAHLYTVGIDTNALCNLACAYCYLDAYNPRTAPIYADLRYFQKALVEVNTEGVDLIALVGKEPFADERGIKLLAFLDDISCSGSRFRYGVVTNGTLIDRYLERLPRSLAYIDISLDGTEETNDSVRGSGVFRRAGGNIKSLVNRGYEVWISCVLHNKNASVNSLSEFMRTVVGEFGCSRFYFSPVRNFTGTLRPFLLSFEEISRAENDLAELAEGIPGIDKVILDHPYEAVWRDYFWPLRSGQVTPFQELVVDEYGNVLREVSKLCFQKLDIFPHGPWGTCRLDARGTYLADVESRTYSNPEGVGSILARSPYALMEIALKNELMPMLQRFLLNLESTSICDPTTIALTAVSIPENHAGGTILRA